MTKAEAIEIFGRQADMARALRVSRQLISAWPDDLDDNKVHWIAGAAIKSGLFQFGHYTPNEDQRLSVELGKVLRRSRLELPELDLKRLKR